MREFSISFTANNVENKAPMRNYLHLTNIKIPNMLLLLALNRINYSKKYL